jgi:CDP-diacylglycerol---serine O-phosphatidyltransferase
VFSGKKLGTRVPREIVLPVFVVVVLFVALLISYPWIVLTIGTLLYLGCLPLSWLSYRRMEQRLQQQTAAAPGAVSSIPVNPPPLSPDGATADDNRPARLN